MYVHYFSIKLEKNATDSLEDQLFIRGTTLAWNHWKILEFLLLYNNPTIPPAFPIANYHVSLMAKSQNEEVEDLSIISSFTVDSCFDLGHKRPLLFIRRGGVLQSVILRVLVLFLTQVPQCPVLQYWNNLFLLSVSLTLKKQKEVVH